MLGGVAAIPTVYDEYAPPQLELAANDTTYANGTFVIYKTTTCTPMGCFYVGAVPNDFTTRYSNDYAEILLLTYETGFGDALDSAVVDSIWTAWGLGVPLAYDVDVPGATIFQNEPAGFIEITDFAFSDTMNAPTDDWARNNNQNLSWILYDANAPFSPDSIGAIGYPYGFDGGVAPETWFYRSGLVPGFSSLQADSLYVRYNFKVSANWVGHDGGTNKINFFTSDGQTGGPLFSKLLGSDGDSLIITISEQGSGLPNAKFPEFAHGGDTIARNRWYQIEHLLVLNTTVSDSDGIVRTWVNGDLVFDTTSAYLWSGNDGARWWSGTKWNPVWGGTGDSLYADEGFSPGDTMFQYIDHYYVSGNLPYPNEPDGFVQGTYMAFSDTFNAPTNDWDRNNGTPLSVIVVDSERDSVGRMYYEADATSGDTMSGTAPDNWFFKTATGGIDSLQSDSLYVSYYLKLSRDWQGQESGVNKTLYVSREGSASAPVYYSAQGTDSGALRYQVRLQGLSSQVMAGNQGANDTIYRGQWHRLEHLHVMNTADGVADGITKVWIDGVLTHSYANNLLWNDDGDGRWWELVKWNPIWGGGTSDSLEADQYQYVDNIYVSGNDNN